MTNWMPKAKAFSSSSTALKKISKKFFMLFLLRTFFYPHLCNGFSVMFWTRVSTSIRKLLLPNLVFQIKRLMVDEELNSLFSFDVKEVQRLLYVNIPYASSVPLSSVVH